MTQRRFFIFSLPRSGSSWLSVFLSGAGSYCYHEPFADGDLFSLAKRIYARPEPCVGAIDTSAYRRTDLDLTGFERFILVRDLSQVRRSFDMKGWKIYGGLINEWDDLLESGGILARAHPIYYGKLHDLNYLESVWDMVVGLPFDRERAEYLIEMNIQRTFDSVMKRAAS